MNACHYIHMRTVYNLSNRQTHSHTLSHSQSLTRTHTHGHTHTRSENWYININVQKHGHKHYRSSSRGPPVCQKYTYTVYCIYDQEKTSFVHHGKFISRRHLRAAEQQWYIQKFIGDQNNLHTHSTLDKTGSTGTSAKEKASKHRDIPHRE